ncbi:hypothetical protein NGA35_09340 [Pseudomonas stutzeri]|nr:hypothetical protein [Stutzerimonas stutzeri]
MNCKTDGNLDDLHECCGQCDGERPPITADRALQMELEWRAQERIAIAELVDQAHHLIGEVIRGEHGPEVLAAASSQLAKASQLLNWPTPFDPALYERSAD